MILWSGGPWLGGWGGEWGSCEFILPWINNPSLYIYDDIYVVFLVLIDNSNLSHLILVD